MEDEQGREEDDDDDEGGEEENQKRKELAQRWSYLKEARLDLVAYRSTLQIERCGLIRHTYLDWCNLHKAHK